MSVIALGTENLTFPVFFKEIYFNVLDLASSLLEIANKTFSPTGHTLACWSASWRALTSHLWSLQWGWRQKAGEALLPIPDDPLLDSRAELRRSGAWALLSHPCREDSLWLRRWVAVSAAGSEVACQHLRQSPRESVPGSGAGKSAPSSAWPWPKAFAANLLMSVSWPWLFVQSSPSRTAGPKV